MQTIPICAASGELGPKRREGDLQVPEGFYTIDRFNPVSSFHLSLGLSYPNRVDRKRAGAAPPGGDIFIHGSCVTVGCLPLRDGPMETLYLAAIAARDHGQRGIPVHVFPCRFDEGDCQDRLADPRAEDPSVDAFWTSIEPGYSAFESTGRPPRIRVTRDGRYVVRQ